MVEQKLRQGYKPTEFGIIPEEWNEVTLNSLSKSFTKQTGFDYSATIKPNLVTQYNIGTIPFIQNRDFKSKKINFNTDYFIPENIANKFPKLLVDQNCLLITISGSIGNIGLISNVQKSLIGGDVAVLKFIDENKLEWVMYYLLSNNGQKILQKNVKASSHQHLMLIDIREILIPIPSSNERFVITQIFSDMDDLIIKLEDQIKKKNNIKHAVVRLLFSKGIGHKKFKKILLTNEKFELIPEEWKREKFGDHIELIHGYTFTKNDLGEEKGIPIIKIGQIKEGHIDFSNCDHVKNIKKKEFETYLLKKGDVLIALSGATLGKVGQFTENVEALQNQRVGKVIPKNNSIDQNFIFYLMTTESFKKQLFTKINQHAQGNLGKKEMATISFFLPKKLSEQQEIAKILSDIDMEISEIDKRKKKLIQIKKAMMQKLLTGEIRIK
jgi:type I restriction enzyme, S subunit